MKPFSLIGERRDACVIETKRATASRELDEKGLRDATAARSLERLHKIDKVRPEIAARFESSRLGRKKCSFVPQCCQVGTNCKDQTSRMVATVNMILNEGVGCTGRRDFRYVEHFADSASGPGVAVLVVEEEAQRSDWAVQI